MTDEVFWSNPTARKSHRCDTCGHPIRAGERYYRIAIKTGGSVHAERHDPWCAALIDACASERSENLAEWLEERHPDLISSVLDGWQTPDGSRVPVPLLRSCVTCGRATGIGELWCEPCDDKRIGKILADLANIRLAISDKANREQDK